MSRRSQTKKERQRDGGLSCATIRIVVRRLFEAQARFNAHSGRHFPWLGSSTITGSNPDPMKDC